MMATKADVPKYYELMNPLLAALHDLGGSATNSEIYEEVIKKLDLTDEIIELPHNPEKTNQTEVEYRLAWARTYLKKFGILENSQRGVWHIQPEKRNVTEVDPIVVRDTVRQQIRDGKADENSEGEDTEDDSPTEVRTWREELHRVLTTKLSPEGFERLTKRLLREAGFIQVEVTGRSGDGGIDGKGIMQVGGLLSFHIVFQCKRYKGTVSSGHIRDFRGAMVGRADKGLFMTTGSFSRDAKREAIRDGATPIDLIDGEAFAEKLKELELGVETHVVQKVEVDQEWFSKI